MCMKSSLYIFTVSLLLFFTACSSGGSTPSLPEDDPVLTGEGHVILTQGTFEINPINLEIINVTNYVNPIQSSFKNLIPDYFDVEIVNLTNTSLTLRMTLENPFNAKLYDMRIIFTDLYGKIIANPDGFSNFLSTTWNAQFNPFIYFAKENENHMFPIGPGGTDSEDVIFTLSGSGQFSPYISYLIECSVGENAAEPVEISNISTRGSIIPIGGAMVVQCDVHDWQNNVSRVTILPNDFNDQEVEMYWLPGTSSYAGNLLNRIQVPPGDYAVWINAESSDSPELSLVQGFLVNVPDPPYESPVFEYCPSVDISYERDESQSRIYSVYVFMDAHVISGHRFDYIWEAIYPSEPQGGWVGTGFNNTRPVYSFPPIVNDNSYLFEVSVSDKDGHLTSNAIVGFPTEIELEPAITEIPDILTVMEDSWVTFEVKAYDPNRPDDNRYLSYEWRQSSGGWGGEWLDQSCYSPVAYWRAPSTNAEGQIDINLEITKSTGYFNASIQREIKVIVKPNL
jgi:hypothetical protein